jgi:hypothetical protein
MSTIHDLLGQRWVGWRPAFARVTVENTAKPVPVLWRFAWEDTADLQWN